MRWLGRRPKVRGVAMNLVITHTEVVKDDLYWTSTSVSLWPALGQRTRKAKKYSNKFIIKRRKSFK
jgi:large subunit ribosomal protein L2